MNEKIKELLDKAEVYYNDDMYSDYNDLASLQKFAELIVRECAETCKENLVNDAEARAFGLTYNDAVGDCVIQIKQHFGVEE